MLTVLGPINSGAKRFCDGVSRRSFLRIGALGMGAGALTLGDLLRLEAQAATNAAAPVRKLRHKAVINICLDGGPPHQDMWDIKTEAPSEIRGEFRPIDTKVSGIQIGEVFPQIAARMDKFAVIRSIVGANGRHDLVQCTSGWTLNDMRSLGGRPSLGSALSKLRGPVDPAIPPFIGLAAKTGHIEWSDPGTAGFLGPIHSAFRPDGEGLANMRRNETVSISRLGDRRELLTKFDRLRRELDSSGTMQAKDNYDRAAFEILASSKLVDALDLSKEDAAVRERYGTGKPFNYQYDGAPTENEHLLLARRLVEAGARCVTLSYGRWDSHGKNFDLVRDHGGKLDQCLSALIDDLDQRGMLNDVAIVVWGEFGRTPRINAQAGRDHWPQVSCALLAGGGLRTGQVIGATNRLGEVPKDRPVHFQEVFSTLYHTLGIDAATTTIADPSGRPQYLSEKPAMRELV
ncbi:MAG: DUF1501 domain-containing protein [Planctomycetes bacterium]|nr:DUF1501 domain-containing protein [Planctomycetota bacterium]